MGSGQRTGRPGSRAGQRRDPGRVRRRTGTRCRRPEVMDDITSDVDTPAVRATERKRKRGRPRDRGIDERIIHAATAVYAERGWTGFNFDVIARRAGVSKDAIYRRYESPVALLLASWSGARLPEHPQRQNALAADADIRDFLMAVGG